MADKKISQLPAATLPLAGTELLPIVQSGTTDNITVNNLAAGNLKSNTTTGVLQVTGPAAASTRVMTTPNANFTVARTDAAQTFTGNQTVTGTISSTYGTGDQLLINAKTNDATAANNSGLGLRAKSDATGTNRFAQLWFDADGGNLSGGDYFLITKYGNDGTADIFNYSNSKMQFAANYIGRAAVDLTIETTGNVTVNNGNLVIGTSGKGVTTESSIALGFGTNNSTSQAYLNTNGKLLVGASSTTYGTRLGVYNSASADPVVHFDNAHNTSGDVCSYFTMGNNAADASSYFVQMFTPSQDKVYIYGTGSFANRTGTYGTISDVSMKENIIDATPKLQEINKLNVRNFNFIDDENKEKQIGFIAQEFEQVFPSMVFEDGKTGKKQIKTSILIPILVKAVQELSAEVEALKQQVKPAS